MLSKLKKKVKHRLAGSKHEPGRTGADAGGERVAATGSVPQPGPHVVVSGGHDQEGSEANAVGEQVLPANRPSRLSAPEPAPGGESENDQEEGKADVDEREDSQKHSMGSGPGGDGSGAGGGTVEQVYPSPSTPSIPHSGNPGGVYARSFWLPPLIALSNNVETSTVPDHGPEVLRPDESAKPSAPADKKSNWGSTASATAKLLLRGVRDSSDAFGPLKSVASGLCFILENCEVWSPSRIRYQPRLRLPQRTRANKQAIESLAPRIKALSASLCAPASKGDANEEPRRKELGR
jgi:hypothetical protein